MPDRMNSLDNIARSCRRAYMSFARKPDRFLRSANGVVHVGANSGQERDLYDLYGLPVLWIEPLPDVFLALDANIADYPQQQAVQALVTDRDGKEYDFHVASNDGQSSSIFNMQDHSDIWPDVVMEKSIRLVSRRLDTLLDEHNVDTSRFDTLVMDTQGSELLVLQGASKLLQGVRFIKTEAADFPAYEGCCLVDELSSFLETRGYEEATRVRIATRSEGGSYYDVMYRKSGESG